ncbi:Hypothetical Protein FCC1311_082372 [Hondaea fermentalgiana]|uniref:t-SNARE coiled-coil homology domain-containing protein n=1 Tax=Hondaea fermentalgiana TaxID=2315210 RepID=A0A2R5GM88_9STRA|nr:Hypothetical Protein FCC1311_082372 [Hondaea fermentalgiana]|eukprot:GBG32012.1 Hypothetical Protein FCC1311_082372 [Hondaea fermentalgiana]
MRDAVNARRLARACAAIVGTAQPTRRDAKRLKSYLEVLRAHVDTLQRAQSAANEEGHDESEAVTLSGMEIDELAELTQKLALFESFVQDHVHVLRRGEALPEAPPLERQASQERERLSRARTASQEDTRFGDKDPQDNIINSNSSSSSSSSYNSVKPQDATDLHEKSFHPPPPPTPPPQAAGLDPGPSAPRDHEQELEELLGRAPPSSFADFMAGNGAGSHAVEDQLRQMEVEQETLKDDVSEMVGSIRQRLLGINEDLQTDKQKLDMVEERADRSLDMLGTMSKRLNITMASSSYNCKMCALGVIIVLALWVFAYLVMRIFPKVK